VRAAYRRHRNSSSSESGGSERREKSNKHRSSTRNDEAREPYPVCSAVRCRRRSQSLYRDLTPALDSSKPSLLLGISISLDLDHTLTLSSLVCSIVNARMAFQLELESAVDDATCASREGLVRGAGGGAMPTLHEIAAGIEVLLARHDSSIVLELLHRVPSDALHDFVRVLSQRLLDSDASAIGSNPGSAYSSPLSNSIEALDDLGPPRQHRPQTGSISIRAGNPDDTRHASPRDDSVDNNCTDDLMGSSWEGTSFRRDGRWWALYAAELASSPAASRSFDQRARGTASLIEHSNRGAHPPHHHHQQHQHQHDVEPHHLHTAPTPELSPSHATAPPPASSLRALSQSSLVLPKGNGRCMVIVPSLSVDLDELAKMEGEIHYEERQLFYLLNLRDPSVHIVYVSSIPIHPSIVDYYLSLIPNYHENKELLSRRLSLISAFDNSKIPLTSKILSRPRMIQKIRRTVREVCGDNLDNAELLCFIPTQLESLLASKLQLRFLCSPATMGVQFWGSKPGSRQIFRQVYMLTSEPQSLTCSLTH